LSPTPPAAEPAARGRWAIVALLAAALFVNYVDRGALPTAGHLIQDDLGISTSQLGFLFSAFYWSYALLQIPVGWLADRYGAWRILAAGLTLWACATMLVGTAHSFTVLFGLRLLLGVGESAGFPCVSKLLATVMPIGSLGRANGVVAFGYLFGPAVGAYCGGLLLVSSGWRTMFLVFGATSLLWLLPWARLRPPSQVLHVDSAGSPSLPTLLRQMPVWGTSLGHFSSNYTFYFMLNWLPYYLVSERGFSTAAMAAITGSAYLVNALSAISAGWIIDRMVRRPGRAALAYKSAMVGCHVGCVVCMPAIALGSQGLALGAIFAYQILMGMASPGTFAIAQILAGPKAAGRWVGIQNTIANLAGILAPAVAGVLAEYTHHFTAPFILAASISVLGLFGWVWMVGDIAPLDWSARTQAATARAARAPLA